MSKEEIVNDASMFLNSMFDEAHKDYNSIELSESDIKGLIYSSKMNFHSFSENRKCSVKFCRKKAVNSHLFQESILKKNSQNGHYIYPSADLNKRQIKLEKIGVNKALTFPGFCITHENMFEYEKKEQLNYEHELRTLVYKAICYNHVYWDIIYKYSEDSITALVDKKHKQFEKSTNNKYKNLLDSLGIEIKKLHFSDPRHKNLKQHLKERKIIINDSLIFKKLAWKDIESNKNENLKSYVIELDTIIPIFFSYFGNLTIKNDDLTFDDKACLIIHPFKESTKLIFTTTTNNHVILKNLLNRLTPELTWNFILSSLVYISDNWLINEEFYNKYIPVGVKELLESAVSLPLTPPNK
ncbi:hypothetical protein [Flavobacterium restrictum]|uniref:Uncharacterized protein n=1 Tax=Flavobacterium restrictum TaxID=2594428 RepID=A0A553DQ42_9FLAO|nr:hypothetical protein [Flavobacterium restrictum]TRX34919.1 hypothetical protein FNW21_15720 [Flavobacterium restrictum]